MLEQEINSYLSEFYPETIVMDGYDDCIVGVVERSGNETVICYDKKKVLKKLVLGGMSEDEAHEWFYFNQLGANMGEMTPCFLDTLPGFCGMFDLDKLEM